MAKVFPGLDKFGGSEYRRLVLASKLNTADAISKARQFAAEIDNAIAAARAESSGADEDARTWRRACAAGTGAACGRVAKLVA